MSNLFTIPTGASPSQQGSIPGVPSPSAPTAPGPLPRPKWWHHSPDLVGSLPPQQDHIQGNSQGVPLSEVAGGDASLQGIDEKPSRSIQPRLLFGKKGQGVVLQGPSHEL